MDFDSYEEDEAWIQDEGNFEDDVLACPECRRPVHEDTQKCPHCGDWIIPVYPTNRSKKWIWAVVTVLLVLALIMLTVW